LLVLVEKIAAMVLGGFLALLSFTFSYQYAMISQTPYRQSSL